MSDRSNVKDMRASGVEQFFARLYDFPQGDTYGDVRPEDVEKAAYGVYTHGGKEIDPLVIDLASRDPHFAKVLEEIRGHQRALQLSGMAAGMPTALPEETLQEYTARQNIPTLAQGMASYDSDRPVAYDPNARVVKALPAMSDQRRVYLPHPDEQTKWMLIGAGIMLAGILSGAILAAIAITALS